MFFRRLLPVRHFVGVFDKLAEAVGEEGADPGDQAADDDKQHAADPAQALQSLCALHAGHVHIAPAHDHDDADENRQDDAQPADEFGQTLDLSADVIEHVSFPFPFMAVCRRNSCITV